MDRKKFLKKLGLGTLGSTVVATGLSCRTDDNPTTTDGNDEHCGFTDSATAGPFFVRNTTEAVNLNSKNLPGIPMKVMGTIYDNETEVPIPGAKIEIWHADDSGVYHPTGSGDVSDYDPSEITLRGFVIANENGQFAVNSIQPGLYTGRRRHIHYRITVPGYEELITQSYWKGSARIDIDRTDANTEDCRYVDFQDDSQGGIVGVFDIYLKRS